MNHSRISVTSPRTYCVWEAIGYLSVFTSLKLVSLSDISTGFVYISCDASSISLVSSPSIWPRSVCNMMYAIPFHMSYKLSVPCLSSIVRFISVRILPERSQCVWTYVIHIDLNTKLKITDVFLTEDTLHVKLGTSCKGMKDEDVEHNDFNYGVDS